LRQSSGRTDAANGRQFTVAIGKVPGPFRRSRWQWRHPQGAQWGTSSSPGPPKRSRPCSRKASQWHPPARKLSRNCRLVGRHEEGHVRRGRTCRGPAGRTRNPRGLAERRPSIARSRIKKIHAVVGRDGAAPRLARSCQIISKEDAEQFMGIKNPRVSGLQDATPIPARRARYNSPDASASNISPGMAMLAILCDGKV
jgi:hypothetical protein